MMAPVAIAIAPRLAHVAAASPQSGDGKAGQDDVEGRLERMLDELKRENARRGIKPEPASPAKSAEEKPVETPVPERVAPPTARPAAARPEAAPVVAPTPASSLPGGPAVKVDAVRAMDPSGRSPLPMIEGWLAPDVQAFLGAPVRVQQGTLGTFTWQYQTPAGPQFIYFINGVATVTAPASDPYGGPHATPERRVPGVQGACNGIAGTPGFKTIAVLNPGSPVFIEPKLRLQPLTLLPAKETAEVISLDGAWYRIRFHDDRWGPRVGYIHCSDVVGP